MTAAGRWSVVIVVMIDQPLSLCEQKKQSPTPMRLERTVFGAENQRLTIRPQGQCNINTRSLHGY